MNEERTKINSHSRTTRNDPNTSFVFLCLGKQGCPALYRLRFSFAHPPLHPRALATHRPSTSRKIHGCCAAWSRHCAHFCSRPSSICVADRATLPGIPCSPSLPCSYSISPILYVWTMPSPEGGKRATFPRSLDLDHPGAIATAWMSDQRARPDPSRPRRFRHRRCC